MCLPLLRWGSNLVFFFFTQLRWTEGILRGREKFMMLWPAPWAYTVLMSGARPFVKFVVLIHARWNWSVTLREEHRLRILWRFSHQLMHKKITLKGILKFSLKQQHVSVWSPSSGSALIELAKVTVVKTVNQNTSVKLIWWCGCRCWWKNFDNVGLVF